LSIIADSRRSCRSDVLIRVSSVQRLSVCSCPCGPSMAPEGLRVRRMPQQQPRPPSSADGLEPPHSGVPHRSGDAPSQVPGWRASLDIERRPCRPDSAWTWLAACQSDQPRAQVSSSKSATIFNLPPSALTWAARVPTSPRSNRHSELRNQFGPHGGGVPVRRTGMAAYN
jgi:hypothetical protein